MYGKHITKLSHYALQYFPYIPTFLEMELYVLLLINLSINFTDSINSKWLLCDWKC